MTFGIQRFGIRCAAAAAAGLTLAALHGPAVAAEAFPTHAVKIMVPYPPGGGTDVLARIVATKLGEALKQPVVIENRGGAGGTIGTAAVAQAAPDGYTILIANTLPHTSAAGLYSSLPFDPVKSFDAVGMIASVPYMLAVNPKVPAQSVKDFIALARSTPGKINYASAGNGSATHLAAELFKTATKVDITHIAYKGGGPALNDLLAGQVQATFENVAALVPHVKSGTLRGMVITGPQRAPLFPDLPTMSESGYPGFDVSGKFGLIVPAGTPKETIATLNQALNQALAHPDLVKQLAAQGAQVSASTPKEFDDLIKAESAKWLKVLKDAKIKND
jgi:tripartite-type tricarboxylate transporter receptor subunit TctC